jgi:hypothetical protein
MAALRERYVLETPSYAETVKPESSVRRQARPSQSCHTPMSS